ncbi:TetR/AcrR family transcriptional regulator [Agromyces sp. Soil535]|uniref:TetR/AcrR family transcriptional regulator n=1 Tax=Agromyces sp. Soil535 TaxID=1736390 RepID=UPI0006F56786|nr:TetR/AcrR family transcriptional regulator [Agromyces sp. Soil535]KRE23055.1 AcrR family transcriptional regulator [Agromyces sp. Soil535]
MTAMTQPEPSVEPVRGRSTSTLGRKRDHTRDPQILEAAVDVLAETGFDGMTIDMVAARAKAGKATIYRRWPSKADLVLDAVACMKAGELDPEHLPDTGTLRGDLVAMIRPRSIEEGERKLRIMGGLFGMIANSPELADAVHAAIIEPRVAVNRLFLRRAIERGEISPDCDVETLAVLASAMAAFRVLVQKQPVDAEYLISLIDGVLLPAAGVAADRRTA